MGGGSLAGSLYLGVLGGYCLLWLQLVAIILGVIMRRSIAYISLSAKEKPFVAINKHIRPVLGWGWALATLLAACTLEFLPMTWLACRRRGVGYGRFVVQALLPALPPLLPMAAVAGLLSTLLPVDALGGMILHGALAAAVYLAVFYRTGLKAGERQWISARFLLFTRARTKINPQEKSPCAASGDISSN